MQMANHKSAKKRNRQNLNRNNLNKPILSQIKSSLSKFNNLLPRNDKDSQPIRVIRIIEIKISKPGILYGK